MLQDSAARALWLLIKSDKKCLAREEGLSGCDPLQLAGQLIALIETAEAEEVRPTAEGVSAAALRDAVRHVSKRVV